MANTATNYPIYRRVYVWEWAVRFFHWVNAVCIVVLGVTGYLIGEPMKIFTSSEAYKQHWFGIVRFIHFTAAYIFVFNILFRIYWAFVGNKFARWYNFVPYTKENYKEIAEVLKVDFFQIDPSEKISFGHNSWAGFNFLLLMLASVFQILSGFALYAPMSSISFPRLIGTFVAGVGCILIGLYIYKKLYLTHGKYKVTLIKSIIAGLISFFILYFAVSYSLLGVCYLFKLLMNSEQTIRWWHHLMLWYFVVFTIIHVYLTFYHDYIEGRGTVSSMVGGWKFSKKNIDDIKKTR